MEKGWQSASSRLHIFRSVIERVAFICDRMSYVRGRWCDIIVLNVHAPIEDKSEKKKRKRTFYEELSRSTTWLFVRIFHSEGRARRYFRSRATIYIKLKLIMEIESTNVATSKNLILKSAIFPYRDIHKYTWTTTGGKTQQD
jgi:hypothetical protein